MICCVANRKIKRRIPSWRELEYLQKIFDTYVTRPGRAYNAAVVTLSLPATPYELLDVQERLRTADASETEVEIVSCRTSKYLNLLPIELGGLHEVNALAEKMSSFENWQQEAFDGLVKADAFKSDQPIPISRLIDFAYSTECCHVLGGITTDKELGEFLVENGVWGDEETLIGDVYKNLNFKAIGQEHRLSEGGIFTTNSYIEQHSDLVEAHRTLDLTPQPLDYTVLLKISKGFFNVPEPDSGQIMRLKLPATDAELSGALDQLNVASWKAVGFECIDCKAPMLINLIRDAEDIGEVLELADVLAEMPQKQLTEYKAILTATKCSEFDSAVGLISQMEEYIVTPKYETMEDVARDEMSMIMSPEAVEIMLPYLDLEGYGRALVKTLNADLTEYGMVERKDRQPVQTPQVKPEQFNGMNL